MAIGELLAGLGIGLAGGLSSGLLGVSPGGALVVFSVLLLGAEQHVAQGISLVAQIPPTAALGIQRYRLHGVRCPNRWIVWLAAGFLLGGVLGAVAASHVGARALRWVYVAYLAGLDVLLVVRNNGGAKPSVQEGREARPSAGPLLAVGVVAGISSGFLGIGGGLATTVALTLALGVARHQAQMVSLVLSLIPTTAPPAWVYWREGWLAPWPVLVCVVLGLLAGAELGARVATRASASTLRIALICLVTTMVFYMTCKAL